VVVNFDAEGESVSAKIALWAPDGGGATIEFGNPETGGSSTFTDDQTYSATAGKDSVTVYTDESTQAHVNSAQAKLSSGGELLCTDCSFIRWGPWDAHLNYKEEGVKGSTNVFAEGWWVAGDIIDQSDLPTDANATYAGTAIATVANNLSGDGWITYVAKGDLDMDWDFNARAGNLTISKFDQGLTPGGLTFSGRMTTPGELAGKNQFGGPLSLTSQLPANLSQLNELSGFATGSFVRGPHNFNAQGNFIPKSTPQGVIGNWNVNSANYKAGGIFAGSAVPR